jgi:hypothetical protein
MAAICHNAVQDPERAAKYMPPYTRRACTPPRRPPDRACTPHRFRNPGTVVFCLRVMVSTIILYDHVSPQGAFHKNSPINVRNCVGVRASVCLCAPLCGGVHQCNVY